jgi:aldehyde:ferredoxin oxidoreductase
MEFRMLKIDLSRRCHDVEELPKDVIRKYLGGRGLGSYLLYKLVPAKADPLGEDNHLIFTAGPASGTSLYYCSKVNLNTKSPLTDAYLYSISSGSLSHEMKKAGLWAIAIRGIASSPTYVVVNGQDVEFKDAGSLWGMETAEAQLAMLKSLLGRRAATVAIGQAGEQLVRYAAAFTGDSLYRCFGRGGAGCVMGSKKLKGIAIMGDGKTDVPDKNRFEAAKKEITKKLNTDFKGWADTWRKYETASDLSVMNELRIIPTRNWQAGKFEGWQGIDKSTTPMGWPERGRTCGPYCPTPGTRDVLVRKGPYKGAHSDVEWETIYAFGSNCGVDKMEAVIAASQICDEFGIDTMTTGVTIGFAMECFEKGLIGPKDTDGIELRFGNDEAMITMLKKIVSQQGFGKRLAKGVKKLSQEISGSEAFAMHVKGLELGGYECRGLNGQALQFAIDNRGGCHHGYGIVARAETADGSQLNIKGKGDQVKNAAITRILCDSILFCTFPGQRVFPRGAMAETVSSLFGQPWSTDDLNKVGIRVMCQERLFNMREGITRKDDTLPIRLLNEPKSGGPSKEHVVPLTELLDDYYQAMGWDLSTGNPADGVLDELEIER